MSDSPEQLHIDFQQAFNRHDLEAIVASYEPGALLASVAGPSVQGANAIRERYRAVFAARPVLQLQTVGVHRAGDLAMLHGKWGLQETGPDGSQVRREGRSTEVVRLQPNGRWLYVIDNPSAPR